MRPSSSYGLTAALCEAQVDDERCEAERWAHVGRYSLLRSPCRRRTCCLACAQGLREDGRHGAIYGPFVLTMPSGERGLCNRDQWAAASNQCLYCRAALPKGRAIALARLFGHHKMSPIRSLHQPQQKERTP